MCLTPVDLIRRNTVIGDHPRGEDGQLSHFHHGVCPFLQMQEKLANQNRQFLFQASLPIHCRDTVPQHRLLWNVGDFWEEYSVSDSECRLELTK